MKMPALTPARESFVFRRDFVRSPRRGSTTPPAVEVEPFPAFCAQSDAANNSGLIAAHFAHPLPRERVRAVQLLLALALCLLAHPASAQIQWRISVKFILGAGGQAPTNTSTNFGVSGINFTSRQAVTDNINFANQLLARTGRGFRFNLTEIQDVTGAEGFFNQSARSLANKVALEAVANSNAASRAQFFWRDNAINVYINNTSSGICSFVGSGNIIFAGSASYDALILHESGHFFNLFHTHNTERYRNSDGSTCESADCSCAQLIGGDDGITDTVFDHQCWDRAALVANNPGASAFQIDNVWLNLMSYHLPQDRFTDDQMDLLSDTASVARNFVTTGRTWFVDRNCGSIIRNGSSRCDAFSGPFGLVRDGLNSASSGDIVLIRAGNYNERTTFNRAATLRASRGAVVIGRP